MKLTCTLSEDGTAKLRALKLGAEKLLRPLAQAWASGAQEVLGQAVKTRFTGKGPFPLSENRLGVVTNRLRKSLRATAVQVNDSTGEASVSMGSNVSYFAAHEFGFKGRVQVRGHTRKAVADTQRTARGKLTRKGISDLKSSKLVRGRANYSLVKPHTRQVNIPARRPLGTQIDSPETKLTMHAKIKSVLTRILLPS